MPKIRARREKKEKPTLQIKTKLTRQFCFVVVLVVVLAVLVVVF